MLDFYTKNYDNILQGVHVTGKILMEADSMLFYFRGSRDLVVLYQNAADSFGVHVPIISKVDTKDVASRLRAMESEIRNEMRIRGIKKNEDFLWNIETKTVVCPTDFIEWIPTYSPGESVFIVLDKNGNSDNKIYYFSDRSEAGLLVCVAFTVSKMRMVRPSAGKWSTTGKQVLAFLLSGQLNRKIDFVSNGGVWSQVDFDFSRDNSKRAWIDFKKIPLKRSSVLVEKVHKMRTEEKPKTEDVKQLPLVEDVVQEAELLLSDIVEVGINNAYKSMRGSFSIRIDIGQEVIKTLIMDCEEHICYVELVPGVEKTLEWVKELLDTDTIQLISSSD